MEKDKKSKKNNIDKLRMILDNGSDKDLHPEDEKYLKDLSRRLKGSSKKEIVYRKKSAEQKDEDEIDPLKPKVTIHPREVKKIVKLPELKEEKIESKAEETKDSPFEDEDIFEVDKVEHKEPEFVEVKPKEVEKQEEFAPAPIEEKDTANNEELTEWAPAVESDKETEDEISTEEKVNDDLIDIEKSVEEDVEKPIEAEVKPIEVEKKELTVVKCCTKCGSKLRDEAKFCIECGCKAEVVGEDSKEESETLEEETPPTFIPVKKIEDKSEAPGWEPVDIEEVEPVVDNEVKLEAFKDVDSIDENTAILLYDNGYKTVEMLEETDLKDLTKIKGLKKKIAKKIKDELEERKNEESFEVETIVVGETAEGKVSEDEIESKEQDEILEREMKIEAFEEVESIDENTAVLLYDNGYISVDTLEIATVRDLSKIKGLKKKTAKNIKKELEEKLEESVKVKPILMEKSAEGKVTEDQIKKDDETFDEEENPTPMELHTKSAEWTPAEEEEIEDKKVVSDIQEPQMWEPVEVEEIKEEKDEPVLDEKELDEEPVVDNEVKLEAFKDLDIIDEDTAILLYDNGITTVEMLKEVSVKELGKIKGLKKKTVKNIKKELEKEEEIISKDSVAIEEEVDEKHGEYFLDEEKSDKDEAKEIEEKILTHEPAVESEEEFFEEKEEIEDIPPLKEEKDDVFKDIKSVDEEIAKLLKNNGINSIEALKDKTIKELTKIRGIKKKLAKEIKQDVNVLVKKIDDDNTKNKSYDRDRNPFIDEDEDDGWESLDEEKIPESVVKGAKEFRHGDYTLYEKEIVTKSGKKQKVRFFSKGKPDEGEPIELPDGYEIKENKKTGVPYLRKKK